MCGIVGIFSQEMLSHQIYDSLVALQHRGQDACGISTCDQSRIYMRKSSGLVRDSFSEEQLQSLDGQYGIGHVRYPTAGSFGIAEAQPFYVNSPYGIALAHNGNLVNSEALEKDLFLQNLRHINTSSDSEILLNVFAHELMAQESLSPKPENIFTAVRRLHKRCQGAYAVTALIANCGLVAFRDPHGIRPLIYGIKETEQGTDHIFASESVALNILGYDIVRDLEPGEAMYIDTAGKVHSAICSEGAERRSCIFEYVYFARPDSIIDNVFVHKSRMRMGAKLAKQIKRDWSNYDIDVVIPIPDTSRTAALELSNQLGVAYREGFIKNRYIGRTFIMPDQKQRRSSVRYKLNPLLPEFKDKNVLLVDDSIVRGTTSKQIVQMARESGARKVYFASSAPPVKYPNIYGIDMPNPGELIASKRSIEEICKEIGADRIFYQSLQDLIDSITKGNPDLKRFDCSIFDGDYPVKPDAAYFEKLSESRSDKNRQQDKLADYRRIQ